MKIKLINLKNIYITLNFHLQINITINAKIFLLNVVSIYDKYYTHFLFQLISVLALEFLVLSELRVLLLLLLLLSCNLFSKCLSKFSLLNLSILYVK